ncbi:helix-turn-helix domain-containing protein [Streptomyces sp. NPDC058955]|uniref:helix-turn-helix domain-containing protein n=1 Tax=unclassified Streptomyces TaxID=2593676 RepID=UPI003658A1B6
MNKEPKQGAGTARAFGRMVRFYRERAGISQEKLAAATGYSKSQVAMIERGERRALDHFVSVSDVELGAQGALLELAKETPPGPTPGGFEEYVREERKAVSISGYECRVIPGLLQTPDYARAVFNCATPPWPEEERESMLEGRIARQAVLHRKPPPLVSFVLEMATLTRPLGGRRVLKDNLMRILDIGRLRHVEIQVMPTDVEVHAGISGPFMLLETERRQKQLVYVEAQSNRYLLTEQPDLGDAFARYGILRSQALSSEASARWIERVAREL